VTGRGRLGPWLHRAFEASLVFKALFALAETGGGIALYVAGADRVGALVSRLTFRELAEDPQDALANLLLRLADAPAATDDFYAAYLLSHGAIKLALVAGLALRIRRAYPVSIFALGGFILYQLHRWQLTHAPAMLVLSVVDLVVIWLVWREYRSLPATAK